MTVFADLSHHQATVNLTVYATAHDRVVLKATEGTSYTDPTFLSRWREAGTLGLARVAYHFARNANRGSLEFDYFLSVVDSAGIGPRDWLCLDSEDDSSPGRAAAAATEFTSRAVERGYPQGLVYTGLWYAQPNGLTPGVFAPGWRRLWLSDYNSAHTDTGMPLPAGWTRDQVVARQFTSTATVPGISGPCDYNRVINEWVQEGDDSMSAEEVAQLSAKMDDIFRLLSVGDSVNEANDPQTHPDNIQRLRRNLEEPGVSRVLDSISDKIDQLSEQIASGGGLTAAQVTEIATQAAEAALGGVAFTVEAHHP